MYEKDGEKFFVVDGHIHFWDASPENWLPGAEQYAKCFIECFHAFQGLAQAATHWSLEHFQKYSEADLLKDVFEDGYVDVGIFQPTYLRPTIASCSPSRPSGLAAGARIDMSTPTTDTEQAAALTTAVLAALEQVRDPELDEPITTLGFVVACTISATGGAVVRLRLPTYFCAPNFAFLMVADAHDAVSAVPGISHTEIVLDDHFASAAINQGVAARAGFVRSFDGLAECELDQLRVDFLRKAVLAGTDRVCRPPLAAGRSAEHLAGLTLGDLPVCAERERLRSRRAELGLSDEDKVAHDPPEERDVRARILGRLVARR
ncbi:MAG: metal-sulfur cluster biosynthetic enzyme [Ilumatobacteraceae bacterium]|nr:metal-sulfur cluster biosynthetic enzyme [Ilumatobacteraceae bacterium]